MTAATLRRQCLVDARSIDVVWPFGRDSREGPPADRRSAEAEHPGPDGDLGDSLRRAASGDEEAFGLVYDALAPLVHGIVRRVVRDPAQSEEVTQEVFVELWRLAPRYDGSKGSPRSWAATVAHRRAVDRVRSEQAARDRDDRASRQRQPQPDPVSDGILTRLDHERVRTALAELTDTQRRTIELAYYGGNTYREVAELLDLPEGTVKTRIRDGLIKLRDFLEVADDDG